MGTKIYTISVVWYLPSCNAGGRERFETIRELFFSEREATIRVEYLNNYSEGVEYVMGEMVTRDEPNAPEPVKSDGSPSTKTYVRGRGNNDGTQAAWLNRTTKNWLILSFNGVLGEFRFSRLTGTEIGFSKMSQHARWIPEEELRRLNEGFPGVNRKV